MIDSEEEISLFLNESLNLPSSASFIFIRGGRQKER